MSNSRNTTIIATLFVCFFAANGYAQNVDYFRIALGGNFTNPAFWAPFDPTPPPPIFLGPGNATDDVNFNLGQSFFNTYTVMGVTGVNDQLIVHNDSVQLDITDYELDSGGLASDASIVVGASPGDVGIAIFAGDNAQLQSVHAFLGESAGATGSAIVNGSGLNWSNTETIWVGTNGNGFLIVLDGTVSSLNGAIAFGANTTCAATVAGANSVWNNQAIMLVGAAGDGTLEIEDGGTVVTEDASVGTAVGSIGAVVVEGIGSTWTINNDLFVAEGGDGSLDIMNGGAVFSGVTNRIGELPGTTGLVTVDGPGSTWMPGVIRIGGFDDPGNGRLRVQNGGNVTAFGLLIEGADPFDSRVTVTGAGSSINLESTFRVGSASCGRLSIFQGGLVTCDDVRIATDSGAMEGRIFVESGSQLIVEDDIDISGANGSTSGGIGVLRLISETTVNVGDEIRLYPNGTVDLAGGTLCATSIEFINGGGDFDWGAGTLHVESFDNDLVNPFGTLAPGSLNDPVGSTTIFGDYTQDSGATLEIDVSGVIVGAEFDFVNVADDASLDGTLELNLVDGFLPTPEQTFTILSACNIFGFFDNVSDNQRLDTVDGSGSFLVRYGVTSPNPNQIVLSEFELNFILGDVNGDGNVDLLDVGPFVDAITDGIFIPAADINMDGVVDLLDVLPFVGLLNDI